MAATHCSRGSFICELQTIVMKTLKTIIAGLAVILFTTSAFTNSSAEAYLGEKAPALVLSDDSSAICLEQLKGSRVVLAFWSAADAHSRIALHEAKAAVKRAHEKSGMSNTSKAPLRLISVNLDRSEPLMREIMKIDSLDTNITAVFHINPATPEAKMLMRNWAMAEGLRTFVIAPDGTIEAVDPTPDKLSALLCSQA